MSLWTSQAHVDNRLAPVVLAAVRVVVGFLYLSRGLQGFGLFGGIDGVGGAVDLWTWPDFWGSALEVAGGGLVVLGLCTRTAAFVSSGVMAYAVHAPMGLLPLQNMGEQAALLSWVFLLIAVLGPGRFALRRG
ncbi:DoxX family protein [Actinokineospora auranticolor]|uniref:DoxX family protein n=1 Tax=Actinokineospora auranticolor TaxID=155976 RepID=UPI001FE63F57|nr:DoxX family protein [Actinokineospora auranticolor]